MRLAALALLLGSALPTSSRALSLPPLEPYEGFFDPGNAELSPRCQAVALAFVDWWHWARNSGGSRLADTRVVVHGHADAAEAAARKARVSRARADAVAAFLRLNGIPAEVITVDSFDATRLRLRASGPEQRNRRVEIVPN